jgi:hypothetical protein
MNAELKSPESRLREARERLQQEWAHLQVAGRALTPEEQRRSDMLGRAIPEVGPIVWTTDRQK